MESTNKPTSLPVVLIADNICYYYESYEQYLSAVEARNNTGVLEGWKFKAPCKIIDNSSITKKEGVTQ